MTAELDYLKNKVYYSQNREDLLVEAFFPDVNNGFYVDVGGYDPDDDSVTKLFYKKGWSGINIEPQHERYLKFTKKRIRDINLNCGVSNKNGEMVLRSYINGGLSTFSSELKEKYLENDDQKTSEYKDLTVPIFTLSDIFKKYKVKNIDFIKIDVEGLEYEVLEGNDWTKYRPTVLCIESNNILKDWKKLLEKNNYGFVFFDGLNDYYVDNQSNKAKVFNYVDFIIEKKSGGLKYNDYKLYEAKEKHYDFLKLHEKSQDDKIDELGKAIDKLDGQLKGYEKLVKSPRSLLKMSFKAMFDKIKK